MKRARPANVPKKAKWNKDAQSWVVHTSDGEYDIYTHYNDNGVVVLVLEMEI